MPACLRPWRGAFWSRAGLTALLPPLGASASRHRVLRARRPGQQELVSAGSLLGGMELHSPARCVCHACGGWGAAGGVAAARAVGDHVGEGTGCLQVGGASANVSSQEVPEPSLQGGGGSPPQENQGSVSSGGPWAPGCSFLRRLGIGDEPQGAASSSPRSACSGRPRACGSCAWATVPARGLCAVRQGCLRVTELEGRRRVSTSWPSGDSGGRGWAPLCSRLQAPWVKLGFR